MMKKIISFLLLMIFSISMCFAGGTTTYAAGASLTGPGSVRAGDTITLYLNISDSGKYGIEGTIGYDGSQVTLQSASCNVGGWKYENNGNGFVLYDDQLTSPLGGSATVLTLTFRVNDGVAAGTTINISVSNIITTDGTSESNLGTATYSVTVAAPLSGNANLASLTVNAGTLSPVFSADTTTYSLGEVDYGVSKLEVSATAEDGKAKVSIKGTSLSVGNNTVTITVTAENGAKKTYKINVTRQQDPNYVPSADASLKEIQVSTGTLSPVFSKDTDTYIIYLPYESIGTEFSATGTAADSKAQGVTEGTIDSLVEGVNTATVVCTAEDGSTKTYTISVIVMPPFDGAIPNIEGVEVSEPEDTEVDTEEVESTELIDSAEDSSESSSGAGWMFFLGILIGAGIGVGGVFVYEKYFKNKDLNK